MTAVRVYIATTEGPAEVQRITEEEPNVGSVICLDGKALALPISPDYDAFVRMPTGILERAYGHPTYRMDVSAAISEGMSWQLGALVAHALLAAGRLAQKDEPASQVVWLTGEVNRDLQILPVEYVREKIRRSGPVFAEARAAGLPLILGVPRRNCDELDPNWLAQLGIDGKHCRVLPLETADQLLDLLGLPAPFAKGPQAASAKAVAEGAATQGGWPRASLGLLFALTLLFVLGGFAWWHYGLEQAVRDYLARDPPAPEPPPVPEVAEEGAKALGRLGVTALEIRAPAGASCASVNFGSAEGRVTEVALSEDMPIATSGAAQLCSLKYRIANRGERLEVWIVGARSVEGAAALKTKILAQARMVDAEDSFLLEIRVPRGLDRPLRHHLAVIPLRDGNGGQKEALKAFVSALQDPVGPPEWSRLLADLRAGGLRVARMQHELRP